MKKIFLSLALVTLFAGCNTPDSKNVEAGGAVEAAGPTESAIENLKVYPAATEGMERYVIMLDSLGFDTEYEYKVELIPGKTMEVDNCNQHGLAGQIVEKTVEGFGYNYYEFTSTGDVFSTRMGCPDDTKINKFIYGQTITIRYNSLLPVVVYAPEGFELKYKIWKAGELKEAQKN